MAQISLYIDGSVRVTDKLPGNDCLLIYMAKDLVLDVPYVYCIGAKSFDGWPDFRLEHGFAQIRDLFKLIADRDALDLYANDLE